MAYELSSEARQRALREFMAVLDAAVPAYEFDQAKLFERREEEFIRKEVERKLYEPALPNAGPREAAWVRKFEALSRREELDYGLRMRARTAARKWAEVDGWYYVRKPLTPKGNKADYEYHRGALESARTAGYWDQAWFHQMMLDGMPEGVADFRMECLFLLRRPDGHTDRLVQMRNVVKERTKPIALPSEEYRAPEKFRGWCLDKGNFHWGGNQVELQKLHLDIGRATAWRMVNEVCSCGWLPLALHKEPGKVRVEGLWFFGDTVYSPAGHLLDPDDHGVYWHGGEGYRLSDSGRENPFFQKQPRMFPKLSIRQMHLKFGRTPSDDSETALLRAFYEETCDRLRRTVGSDDAFMLVGSMLAYAAAPEIFEEHSLFPGAWVHGGAGSGKSTICEWLMEFWGVHVPNGLIIRTKSTTPVGLLQALDQYSNIPVWVDEFRFAEVDEDKLGVLHQAFNRGGQAKFNPSGIQRTIRSAFLVSGESTTDDAALRGRYMLVQISAENREKDAEGKEVNHVEWFNAHRQFFFVFVRFIMERRVEFADVVMKVLKTFRETTPGINERIKLVYGIPYAAFVAMGHLLETHLDLFTPLRRHVHAMAGGAAEDVTSDMNINVVWTQIITAFKAKEIPVECFRLDWTVRDHAPAAPNQSMDKWKSYRLFMDPDATLSALAVYLSKQRSQLALKRKDLRDQLSKESYWVDRPGGHRKRFGVGRECTVCWCFDLDRHPLGYKPVSDAEYQQYFANMEAGDPRRGELYAIVHAVEVEERKRESDH